MTEFQRLPFVSGVGLQSYAPAEEAIMQAKASGCDYFYIDASNGGDAVDAWDVARMRRVRALAEAERVRPIVHGNFKLPLGSDVEGLRLCAVAYVEREVALCAELGAPLVVHGGAVVEPRPTIEWRKNVGGLFRRSIASVMETARRAGVAIWVENLSFYPLHRPFEYVFTSMQEFELLLDAIPDVHFILDVGHYNVHHDDVTAPFRVFHDRIAALTLSNNDGVRDMHAPLAMTQGTVDYASLLQCVKETAWKGVIVFETRGAAVSEGLDYLAALWAGDLPRGAAEAGM